MATPSTYKIDVIDDGYSLITKKPKKTIFLLGLSTMSIHNSNENREMQAVTTKEELFIKLADLDDDVRGLFESHNYENYYMLHDLL